MREISPVTGTSIETLLASSPEMRLHVERIRQQKAAGVRPLPSTSVVDKSRLLSAKDRALLLDRVAESVDENLAGRSEMCMQFADLLQRALKQLGLESRVALGAATYYSAGREVFRWSHAWVRVGREVIDGNVDSLSENPAVPKEVSVSPYWGPIDETPVDRRLRQDNALALPLDTDVNDIWWPELSTWINRTMTLGA